MLISCFLLVGWVAAWTSAATLPPTLDLTSDLVLSNLSLTDLRAQSNSSTVEDDLWSWYCTKIDQWMLPKYENEDCRAVLDYFYIQTMDEGGTRRKEFLSTHSRKQTYMETEITPRKYTFGSVFLFLINNNFS